MPKSYEAVYEKGRLKWLNEQPDVDPARVIVTVLSPMPAQRQRRAPPASLAGKVEILGDIVSPLMDHEDCDYPRNRVGHACLPANDQQAERLHEPE